MIGVLIFILGTIVGSFLNVCIYRLPKGRSIVAPRSYCPSCNANILWYDNIPILSYLLLKGRCRSCKSRIPFRYPLVEIITGLSLLSLFAKFGIGAKFYAYSILTSCLIAATFVDFEIREIPDQVTLGGLILGLGFSLAFPFILGHTDMRHSFIDSLMGAFCGGASIYLMGFFGELVFKREAMGGGDVKLLAMIGSFLGWKLVLLAFFIAPFFGSIVGIILKIRKGSETIPYGPYLSLGALVSVFWGEGILKALFYGLY